MSMDIAFPTVGTTTVVAPAAPPAALETGLAQLAATPEKRASLQCKALLKGKTLALATNEAHQVVPELLGNTQVLMVYGNSDVEGVNALYDRLLHEVEPEKIPELTDIMDGLNREMRGLRSKYDPSDENVRKKYENFKGGIGRFFGNAKTLMELLWEDVKPLEKKMDSVGKQLNGRQNQLLRNVTFYDLMYDENEREIKNLIYRIAVMELMRDEIATRAAEVQIGSADLGDRGGEQKAVLAEVANNLDIRIGEFKSRLFVAWATSPQIRMMRSLNITLASRLDNLINLTMPTMKGTILGWRMLIQSSDAAKLSTAVAQASNEALQAYASANAVAVPKIAEAASTPTLSLESVAAMAASIETQSAGVLDAFKRGAAGRDELEKNIAQAQISMKDSTRKLSEGLVDSIIARSNKAIEIETSVAA